MKKFFVLTESKNSKFHERNHKILGENLYDYSLSIMESACSSEVSIISDCFFEFENRSVKKFNKAVFEDLNLFMFKNTPLITKRDINDCVFLFNEEKCDVLKIYNNSKDLVLVVSNKKGGGFVTKNTVKGLNIREVIKCCDNYTAVNNYVDLEKANRILKNRVNTKLMENGVAFIDKETAYISPLAKIEEGTVIYPNVIIEGATEIGQDCVIGLGSKIVNSKLGNGVTVESSHILDSEISHKSAIGPFAYLRPHSHIGENCKVGDFVEVKNANIGNGTKISHLSYIGDSDLGNNINIGCGTITVNYDGKLKHRTVIGDNSFIGCNSNLVAPVNVGKNAFIAAGSTITDDVSENAFAIARKRQEVKENWVKKDEIKIAKDSVTWGEKYGKDNKPTEKNISEFVSSKLWNELNNYMRETCNITPQTAYSGCSMNAGIWKGWNVKYKKSGKSMCTVYPKQGWLLVLIPIGLKEIDEAELILPLCTKYTQNLFKQAVLGRNGKSLAFEVKNEDILNDIKKLIAIRRGQKK